MWYLAYNILLLLASPVILLILLAKKRCRRGLLQRLGLRLPGGPRGGEPVLWVHAVSLGEVVAVVPLVHSLRKRYPRDRIVVSTVTETGREAVEQKLAGVAEHCYAPLDFPWVVSRFIERLAPRAFVFVETELWPNLLRALGRRGVPAVMVNGRLSSKSFEGYKRLRPFMQQMLSSVTLCLMQSERDAERMIRLGAQPVRVVRTGNIKFDQPLPDPDGVAGGLSRGLLGLDGSEELIVAGSTHPVEEEQLLACYQTLQREFPALVLMLAPRHIERAAQVEATVRAKGLAVQRRSGMGDGGCGAATRERPRVILLDTRGELAQVYRHAVLAFVGGTLVPVGGHNLLEPALWGKPVFFGSHTDHCAEIAALLSDVGGGMQVSNGEALAAAMAARLRDRASLQRMGEAAKSVVLDNRGAVQRSLDLIAGVLEQVPPGRHAALHRRVLPQWLLLLLAVPYGLAVRMRVALYRLGWLAERKLPCPVISVGNLTVGGTGKTPVVIALVDRLLASGRRVGVLSRGYRRHSRDALLLVSDGRTLLAGPADAGDEPYLIATRCPRAVVAVGADRYKLGRWVLERHPVDCFVLDDGFQHLALHRDVNLLVVDVSDPVGLQMLLPAGRLREPLAAASRATAVLLTRADMGNWRDVAAAIEAATGKAVPPIRSRFTAQALVNVVTGEIRSVDTLSGRRALAFSGIGNPVSFRVLLQSLGLTVGDEIAFADHHAYRAPDLELVRERAGRCGAEVMVTTEKDAGKLAPLLKPGEPVWAVRLGLDIVDGRERFDRLILDRAEPAQALAEAHA